MNFSLNTKIRYNGQEYSSIEELPPEARAAYERTMAIPGNLVVKPGITARLVINGKTISSVGDMSPTVKKLYDAATHLIGGDAAPGDKPTTPESLVTPVSAADTKPATTDSGWLTKRQIQLIVFVAGVLLALALIVAARH